MINRRTFNLGIAGSVVAAATPAAIPAWAQSPAVTGRWDEYRRIVEAARKLNLATPHIGSGLQAFATEDAVPVFSELVSSLEYSAEIEDRKSAAAEKLVEDAAELLRAAMADDTMPSEGRFSEAEKRSLGISLRLPLDDKLREEYEQLFATAEIRSQYRSKVAWYVNKLKDPDNRRRYEEVSERVCVPWFAIGIIHGMEAGFNFRGHLHNGDSLKDRTKNIPRGLPKQWNPPSSWEDSAVDALRHDKLINLQDWSLASTLYRWETYNGVRSRLIYKINTPYLWSFSNHYTKGKFVADNQWSGSAVSAQCGAAVMLKVLVDDGIVRIPEV